MRFTFIQLFLLFFMIGTSFAKTSSGQDFLKKKVSMAASGLPLRTVLSKLEKMLDIRFSYQSDIISQNETIDLNVQEKSLAYVLDKILFPLQLKYEVFKNKRILLFKVDNVQRDSAFLVSLSGLQDVIVRGKVSDRGNGIAGVSVLLKGTGKGTTTDEKGAFSIALSDAEAKQGILVFSFIGYESSEITIGNQLFLNVLLKPAVGSLGEVVLIGSRRAGRINTESAVPVDVINVGQTLQRTGKADLTSLLNMVAPSFNYNKNTGGDGADAIDLGTLRGLGPDQTLVLINGKRRHQTAFVAVAGTRGRGNSGTDLNAIPEASIDRVEILRDGASAQYGSDAIAGVINIILKKEVKQLTINTGWSGYYDHKYNTLNNVQPSQYYTGRQLDGNTGSLGLNYGLPLGKQDGFINFSGNLKASSRTFRQIPDTNVQNNADALPVNRTRRANGDAAVTGAGAMFNGELPLLRLPAKFYAFGGYNYKLSRNYAFSRNFSNGTAAFPTDANGDLIYVPGIMKQVDPSSPVVTDPDAITRANDIYYNPEENIHIRDGSLSVGIKGKTSGNWTWDLSNSIGANNFHYYVHKTFNASLGANPTNFDAGGFSLLQNTSNFDLSKNFATVAQGLTLSVGAEYRYEQYKIFAGELNSYSVTVPGKNAGSQGFPGFQPVDEVNAHRANVAGYLDVETDITKRWLVDAAIRIEQYSDFGFLSTYKLATRYKIANGFNVRASASTGFRAPSLAQINISNTSSALGQGGQVQFVKITPNNSSIVKAAGVPDLKEETSRNISMGFTWVPAKGLTVTADGYLVKIKNRVVLTGLFDNSISAIAPILEELKVTAAQLFANAVNTTNTGLDIVIDYDKKWGDQSFKLLVAGNIQEMKIDRINVPAALNGTFAQRQTFFSDREQAFVRASAPQVKLGLNTAYGFGKFTAGVNIAYFGKVKLLGYGYTTSFPPSVPTDDNPGISVPEIFNFSGKAVTDICFSYRFSSKISLFAGADNLFNVHPDPAVVPNARYSAYNTDSGGPWEAIQMGFNGTRLFTKLTFSL